MLDLRRNEAVGALYAAYVQAALFTEELENSHNEANLDADARTQMRSDCESFLDEVRDILSHSGISLEQAGHDFWLTRNRHGAGFWDRDLGDIGQALSDAAHDFGEQTLYVGDDGVLYLC